MDYGDTVSFRLYDLAGKVQAQLTKKPIYKPEKFNLEIESLNNGPYITLTYINSQKITNGILHQGTTKNVVIELNISVRNFERDGFIIYPNPATSSNLTVEIKSASPRIRLEIYSLQGERLIEKDFINPTGRIKSQLDISMLIQGQYIVIIKSNNGNTTQRFIKYVSGIEKD